MFASNESRVGVGRTRPSGPDYFATPGRTMDGTILYAKQTLRRSLEEVFDFFSDARNLGVITPPWLRFAILTPDLEMREGATIDYRLHLGPFPLRWTSEITTFEPRIRFVDEQLRGPYRHWIHEHRFASSGELTVVEDIVHYATPGGRLVDRTFVRPQLRSIFRFRQRGLRERFPSVGEDVLWMRHRHDVTAKMFAHPRTGWMPDRQTLDSPQEP